MKSLVCFYRGQFLKSEDYILDSCPDSETVTVFLKRIGAAYPQQMKIIQVGFEFENPVFAGQIKLYSASKASVFILNSFELVSALADFTMTPLQFESLESESGFIEKVKLIREEIAAGRVYQVNLTAPLKAKCDNSAFEIFSHYTKFFTGPYRALLPLQQSDVICFSPEMFLEKTDGRLRTRPIKGSLPSSLDFNSHLIENKKEEAELSMIVDLLRNDLNRLEENEEAVVTQHRSAMQLGYIQHTFSEIEIKTEKSLPEILSCTLPGGSISGCPKTESLKIISEYEPYARQAYTGCIGWWQNNDFCLNLSIRTFIKSERDLFYHAGCGIVFDSDPQKEWNEFLLKTGALNVR